MKIIIILVIISIAALYISGNLSSGGNKYSILSWATSLLFFNIFMAFYLYFFTHQIKKKSGELGLPGKIGPRGYEGDSEYCNFECN